MSNRSKVQKKNRRGEPIIQVWVSVKEREKLVKIATTEERGMIAQLDRIIADAYKTWQASRSGAAL